ncbi:MULTISPECIES: hemolysin family protein [Pseudobutyrivibrio]|jgi:putative hemolysin|uniref:HlyC/CorC family transporter n=2 Tax=Pseudobutyrivibrio TaxID=46205 RepID=A0A2G3DW22_9FIRM|nr:MULTISPECIES: hemolysin family protein [Pseudobutyrivibrio]MBE5903983.1 HlyC/CorC family transporter [Pseudobutyrivibrio sp.]NEX01183.1 HlyC/CorC family transporter [Pseudobutyrivibrio xylanivorans]PHU35065.1 HlyC/CorC family transporter [Pseudobutyrivibrio ruminis]SCX77107.1 putative hemolysin [Pseudobutyrivibrio sp. AR14]SFR65611.1 putative hemolysin [Pseudobutyrivibrio sp. NOR37]
MEDGSNPYILITALAVFAIVELIGLIILYRRSKQENVTEEDVISLVNEGHEDGNILASEAVMIQNIFEFSDTDVKDIMTHRKNIVAIDGESTLREAISFINDNNMSRYPVYIEDLDNIIGILHIKDILTYYDKDIDNLKVKDLKDLMSVAEFVPETHGINTLFAKMQSKKRHMVIVLDEYGQVSGLLSLEDILEEIVGDISDEHDDDEASIEVRPDDTFIMDGGCSLEEVEEKIGVKLSDDFETLNGYLISLYGKIPEDGKSFKLEDDNFVYFIKNVTEKVIGEVFVRRKSHVE